MLIYLFLFFIGCCCLFIFSTNLTYFHRKRLKRYESCVHTNSSSSINVSDQLSALATIDQPKKNIAILTKKKNTNISLGSDAMERDEMRKTCINSCINDHSGSEEYVCNYIKQSCQILVHQTCLSTFLSSYVYESFRFIAFVCSLFFSFQCTCNFIEIFLIFSAVRHILVRWNNVCMITRTVLCNMTIVYEHTKMICSESITLKMLIVN